MRGELICLHFIFHTFRELLNFFGFLDDVDGERVFVGFGDVFLEFIGEGDEFFGGVLYFLETLFVSFFFVVVLPALAGFVARVRLSRGIWGDGELIVPFRCRYGKSGAGEDE